MVTATPVLECVSRRQLYCEWAVIGARAQVDYKTRSGDSTEDRWGLSGISSAGGNGSCRRGLRANLCERARDFGPTAILGPFSLERSCVSSISCRLCYWRVTPKVTLVVLLKSLFERVSLIRRGQLAIAGRHMLSLGYIEKRTDRRVKKVRPKRKSLLGSRSAWASTSWSPHLSIGQWNHALAHLDNLGRLIARLRRTGGVAVG